LRGSQVTPDFSCPLIPGELTVVQETQIGGLKESGASGWRAEPASHPPDSQPEGRHARAARSIIRWKCKAGVEREGGAGLRQCYVK